TTSDIAVSGGAVTGLAVTADPKVYTATFTPTADLASGSASITVGASTYTDAAGNNGGAGTAPTIAIDTLAPTVAITSNMAAVKAGQTALITFSFSEAPTGFTTSDIAVSGGAVTGLAVTADPKVYTATFTPTANLASGSASITVGASSYTDAAGNSGGAGTTPTIAIDTLDPTVTISSVGAGDSTVSGQGGDNTVVGTAEANSTVTIMTGATQLGTTTADGTGHWSYSLTAPNLITLGEGGSKSVTATQTDAAGNTGTSSAFTFAVDTVAPTLTIASVGLGGDTVVSGQTSDNTISGTAEIGSGVVTIKDGATVLGTAAVNSGGNWSFVLTDLTEGDHSLTASQTDAAGNTATASKNISVDTTAPIAVSPVLSVSGDAGPIHGGATADTLLTISGQLDLPIAADERLFIVVTTASATYSIGPVTDIGADGAWTYQLTSPLAIGNYTFSAFVLDAAGNAGDQSGDISLTIGMATAVLAAGTEDTPYIVTAAQLLAGFSNVDGGDSLSVAGLAASNGTVVDHGDGTYTITPTDNFNGPVTLTYNVVDGNGGSVAATQSYTVASVNDAPVVTNAGASGDEDALSITGSISAVDADGETTVALKTGAANGTVTVNADGTYSYTPVENFHGNDSFV
ncbi:cadherin-like domain-containing protein, partial [Variovorax robiniae]